MFSYHSRGVLQSLPHRTRVVQDAPGIDDVERPELIEEGLIQYRPLGDDPSVVVGKVSSLQFIGAGDGIRIVVEGIDLGPQVSSGKRKQTAAGSHVEKSLPVEIFDI